MISLKDKMATRLLIVLCTIHACLAVDSLRFLAVGDWGGIPFEPYESPIEAAVAKQMASVAERYKTAFTLALGDNFYFDGVTDINDKRFKETFEDVFHYDSLMTPWYVLAGNHDHYGNVSAEIAYTSKSKRWNFPSLYYALSFPVPGGKKLEIIMLDTVTLCGNTGYDSEGDQPHYEEVNLKDAEDQWSWLELQLKSSDADYLLVAGHFPVYSIAEHGPTSCLVKRLKPLLYKYKVTAYVCGHDHNLQHIKSTEFGTTVNYFVSGAGDIVENSRKHEADVPAGSLQYFWAELIHLGGFSFFEATANNMTMTFVDGLNTPVYQSTMLPRK